MGKKKGKKGRKNNDWDDDDLPGLSQQAAPQQKKSGGGGFDDGFDDDCFEDEPAPVAQRGKKRGKKKGKNKGKKAFDDDDFEDEAPLGAPAKPSNTDQDDAFKRFQQKAASGKTQKKKEKKKAAGRSAAGFAAFADFADEDQDNVDDMSEDESSSDPEPEPPKPEPVQKKKLTKKEKRRLANQQKAAAKKAAEEEDWDAILEAETGAATPPADKPEPEPPKEEPKPQPPKKLTKAQKKKLKKKQEYERKKAAKEKAAREAAELDALLAGEGNDAAAPATTPPAAPDAETGTGQKESPEPPADAGATGGSPGPAEDDGQPKQLTKNQKKALKRKQKKEEEKRKKAEQELKKKEKKEKDYLDKAQKSHGDGDYKNAVSYLDFLDRSKPEYFGEQSKELRAKIEKEQDNYKKADEMTTNVIFEKDFQKIDPQVLQEAVGLLQEIDDAPILQQNQLEDQNDGNKTKNLLEILTFRLRQFESQEAKAAKRRAKREAKKLADKNKKKGGNGPDARTLAMMQAMGIDPSKRGKRGKVDRKKNKKKGGKSFKSQGQIEQEQREEFQKTQEAERKRKEEEERRLQKEKAEAEEKERQRLLRIQVEEEERQRKQEAAIKRREKMLRKRKDSDSDGDWENSGDDGTEPSPRKGRDRDGDGDEGWENSGDDTDDNDQKRSPEDDDGDDWEDDGSGSEDEPPVDNYGRDAAYVPGDNDFQDEESDNERDQNRDSKRGSGGKTGLSKKEANKISGAAAVEARKAAKLVEEAKQKDTKFRIGINKILKRNDKDWRKQIRKLPERKAYKALFEDGEYANHQHKKTLLRDMIADKIQKADDNWEALILPESVTLLELRVKACLDELSDKRIKSNLRSPIGVIMGHVDTGKTKILDYIRKTKVQDNEAGGITQQIGATFLPIELIKEKAAMVQKHVKKELTYDLPGLLIIDTPGHESFSNLRARGSSLCDIAVLVIDIMHGLEPQTIESIKMLQKGNHPFVIALNKIDRCYGWAENTDWDFQSTIAKQPKHTQEEFGTRSQKAIAELAEQLEINADLWWKVAGKDYTNTTLICPTSAHTGEGLPDLLMLLVQLTQRTMDKQLQYISSLRATILEVKTTVGHGYTLDVVLQNGFINRGDTIVVCGMEGAIKTQIRALLVPAEAKEMRAKGDWQHVDQIQAAAGVRVSAPNLEKAIAGSELLVVPPGAKPEVVESMMDQVQAGFTDVMGAVDTAGMGVFVVASTLGALEALIQFLNVEQKIPICGISIGTVYKKQVMKAAVMLEKREEYACILAFNVAIDPEAEEHAAQMKVRIFRAEIIYNLFDDFKDYLDQTQADRRALTKDDVVFPCKLQIFEDKIFRARDPLILGVKVISGTLRKNTPMVAMKFTQTRKGRVAAPFPIGYVVSMENEGKVAEICEAGDEVAVKIDPAGISPIPMYQRHFDYTHSLYSRVSRRSLDVLKETYREEAIKHLALLKHMKQLFNII